MKIIFLSFFSLVKRHFGTEMELISEQLWKNNEIYVLHCDGYLQSCSAQPKKTIANCYQCKSIFNNGISQINKEKKIKIVSFLKKSKLNGKLKYNFKNIDELKRYKIDDIDIGMGVASSLISQFRDHKLDTKKYSKEIKITLDMAVDTYFSFKEQIEIIKPDIVYLYNGRYAEIRPVLRVCQKQGIKTYIHEIGNGPEKFDLSEDTTPHDFNYIQKQIEKYWLKTDPNKVQISEEWYRKRQNGKDTSWFSFVKEQKKNILPTQFDKSKKNVAIFNSSDDEFSAINEENYTIFEEQNDGIKKIVEHFKDDSSLHFYLRVHPNLKNLDNSQLKEIRELESLNIKNLTIILPESEIDSYAILNSSNIVITFGSTMGIEAVMADKPSILLGKSFYEGLNSIYKPSSEEELYQLVQNNLEQKNKLGALKYGYWEATHGFKFKKFEPIGFYDGTFNGYNFDLNSKQILIRKLLSFCYHIKLLGKKMISRKHHPNF